MAPVNVDPIDAETGEPAEADGPGLTQAQKDKAEFESGLTAAMREVHDRLAASTQGADAAPWSACSSIRASDGLVERSPIRLQQHHAAISMKHRIVQ